jgi:hypothetical protein
LHWIETMLYLCFIKFKQHDMTTATLIKKLNKMNVEHTIVDFNGYNMDIVFTICGMTFNAGFIKGQDEVQDFCREICFDVCSQETTRRFFANFNQLLKYANK